MGPKVHFILKFKNIDEMRAKRDAKYAMIVNDHESEVYPDIEKVPLSPGDFGRQLFLESLPIGLSKSGCLQKSRRWKKRCSKWPPKFTLPDR